MNKSSVEAVCIGKGKFGALKPKFGNVSAERKLDPSGATCPKVATSKQEAKRQRVVRVQDKVAIDVARTILFLASDESRFTTGAEFVVGGGETAA